MRPFIIGTAGHVDHGKTSLVRFLTGVNTDRLREEQERGITIELGFAELTLEKEGQRVRAGIVDVPGHERFVRHMVAGAGGVDLLMMVIAADEGVMPQTREHLDICRLLNVHTGLVILTKTDLVDEEWAELVQEDIRDALADTFLASAPIVPFSTRADEPEAQRALLVDALWQAREQVLAREQDAVFRLPIDRVFSLRGHGTVITGTVIGGGLEQGQEVAILPGERSSRARNLQSFGEECDRVESGMRAAVNLPGLDKEQISRGDVLVRKGSLHPTDILDAEVTLLAHSPRPLEDQDAAILHLGTAHTNVRLRVFDGALPAGATGLVRLHLDNPIVALPGDRFILRGYADIPGHGKTFAGGQVLHLSGGPYLVRHKGARLVDYLAAIRAADEPERLRLVLRSAGHEGLDLVGLSARTGLGPARSAAFVERLVAERALLRVEEQPPMFLDATLVEELGARIVKQVESYLTANPLADGLPRESLRSQLRPPLRPKVLVAILERLAGAGRVSLAREHVGLPGREVRLDEDSAALAARVEAALGEVGLAVPRLDQLAEQLGVESRRLQPIVSHLLREGRLARFGDDFHCLPAPLAALRERLVAHLAQHGQIDTQGFRDLTGLSRRHLIPLAEYFDEAKVTARRGEVRVAL